MYRLDAKNAHGYEWLLISYVPDGSPVKSRMLYASSHALLKRELGLTYFSDEFHGSEPVRVFFFFWLFSCISNLSRMTLLGNFINNTTERKELPMLH